MKTQIDPNSKRAAAFLDTYSAVLGIIASKAAHDSSEITEARMYGALVAAAWFSLTMSNGQLTDDIWAKMAAAALQSAREREAMSEAGQQEHLQ